VAAVLVCYEGKIVLARNANWPSGIFSLITGFIEEGESPAQAAVREVKEELGLDAEVQSFVGHYPFFARNQLLIAFALNAWGTLLTGEEIAEVKSVSPLELKDYSFGRLTLTADIVNDWLCSNDHVQ
jgi:NAD+ diphosphatase